MIFNERELIAAETIDVHHYPVRTAHVIKLRIGELASYGGLITGHDPKVVIPDSLVVDPAFRGFGIGERLVRTLVTESKKLGVETISGHIESEYAIDIRARVFGQDALRFFHDYTINENYPEQHAELPISFDQARQSLVLARESEDDLEFRNIGFDVMVDISQFDAE